MISFYPRVSLRRCLFCVLLLLPAAILSAQPRTLVDRHPNPRVYSTIGGFYESLPEGYNDNNDVYPLLIVVSGAGQLGNGTSELWRVLEFGVGERINSGSLPNSFNVDGRNFKFITIMPQLSSDNNNGYAINALLDYCFGHYRVDSNRVYFNGMSLGGGIVINSAALSNETAHRISAVVPMAEAFDYDQTQAQRIADSSIAIWAFHNTNDPVVSSLLTYLWITGINLLSPLIPARVTYFDSDQHDVWTRASDPNYRENGKNIYEWMLSYSKELRILPVTLTGYSATPVTSAGSTKIVLEWTTSFEENNAHYTIERSTDGRNFSELSQVPATNRPEGSDYRYEDLQPGTGLVYYRLSQTDIDGRHTILGTRFVNLGLLNKSDKLVLYPNPVTNQLQFSLSNALRGKMQVRILSAAGLPVRTLTYSKSADLIQDQLELGSLATGYYILEFTGDNYESRTPFIKK